MTEKEDSGYDSQNENPKSTSNKEVFKPSKIEAKIIKDTGDMRKKKED